ncbi:MAG: SUF system NifU family Fe-S cluster assembly protein [Rhodospirillaceae bacterium]|jgi:nitrogen fixation protein NifU and related proteins|nr:SUF system NifU family Fe-S cluster assembly protein [Rhodospirillaceae bacterium]MBT6116591.1 SUF system NifU family Fe-S cluster assembly protein [Rhodospirillaceae bacterium]
MFDLQDLYQEIIIDHSKRPRNFGALEGANRHAEGDNPLCGDQIKVHLIVEGDTVREARFEGRGCAISTASASVMTDTIKGKPVAEVKALFEQFHRLVTGEEEPSDDVLEVDRLGAFAGVRDYPMRVKCATLSWHTMNAALEGRDDPISTE